MADPESFLPGDVVSGLEPSELVEIRRVAPFGGKMLVEGVGLQSRRIVKRPFAVEELAALVKVRGQQHTFDGDAELFLLGAEAERIRIAHQFDRADAQIGTMPQDVLGRVRNRPKTIGNRPDLNAGKA